MDKIKTFILNNQNKLGLIILAGASIGAFNCLTRPDYNLIGYLYVYYIWYHMNDNKVSETLIEFNLGSTSIRKANVLLLHLV